MRAFPAVDLERHLLAWLSRNEAARDLGQYFREPATPFGEAFTGRWFERLGDGGDSGGDRDQFTAYDLVAVQTLSVLVPPDVAVELLHGRLGRLLEDLLPAIPVGVRLGETAAEKCLQDDSPAAQAWGHLNQAPGVGWVTAGKLMARKRPHLLPVYDRVVRCALGAPPQVWSTLHTVFARDTHGLRDRIQTLRRDAAVPPEVSDLRVLDVVVWMGHRGQHNRAGCRAPGISAHSLM